MGRWQPSGQKSVNRKLGWNKSDARMPIPPKLPMAHRSTHGPLCPSQDPWATHSPWGTHEWSSWTCIHDPSSTWPMSCPWGKGSIRPVKHHLTQSHRAVPFGRANTAESMRTAMITVSVFTFSFLTGLKYVGLLAEFVYLGPFTTRGVRKLLANSRNPISPTSRRSSEKKICALFKKYGVFLLICSNLGFGTFFSRKSSSMYSELWVRRHGRCSGQE